MCISDFKLYINWGSAVERCRGRILVTIETTLPVNMPSICFHDYAVPDFCCVINVAAFAGYQRPSCISAFDFTKMCR